MTKMIKNSKKSIVLNDSWNGVNEDLSRPTEIEKYSMTIEGIEGAINLMNHFMYDLYDQDYSVNGFDSGEIRQNIEVCYKDDSIEMKYSIIDKENSLYYVGKISYEPLEEFYSSIHITEDWIITFIQFLANMSVRFVKFRK